ncbi:NUDIX domain-containing protein [Streptomyces sp. NA02950]|uniref:NUDIX hydrolase n=1 Tax=Streptomyces sp. NA02950 TaxID=2742137 RepID=UPI0015916CE1|nr:NUDIX domain-containing protein [Streptomyces sp. NA02950]QKV93651.1 NUDIX domain-containing protein [Streptomyces sp. NA02950]
MSADRPHSVRVAGVVVDTRGRALLVKRRDGGGWEPPGGTLDAAATIPEALRREILAETGVTIALPATLTGVYKDMTGLVVSLVFRCTALDGAPVTGLRTRAWRWATRTEVADLADAARAARILDALNAVDTRTAPVVGAHDGVATR